MNKLGFQISVAVIEPVGGNGGMQWYNLGLSTGLSKNISSVYLFSSNLPEHGRSRNVFVYNWFGKVWCSNKRIAKLFWYCFIFAKVLNEVVKKKCQVLHFHQFEFSLLMVINVVAAKMLARKVVLTLHDVESFDVRKKSFITSMAEKVLYKYIDRVIVHNKYSFEIGSRKIDANCLSIVKHGNYIPFFKKVASGFSKGKLKILFFGQIKKVKGLDVLLNALAILRKNNISFEATIAGRVWRDDFSIYQNIIDTNHLSDSVKIDLRFIPDEELCGLFEKSSLVVLPYRSIYQSGVLLKSMSFGRPVICADLPAFREVIVDCENGFLFQKENADDLAKKLHLLNSNRDLLAQVGTSGYDYVYRNHDWDDIGEKTAAVYKMILRK
jgi:D-inositol-3-phosphate glycosyltransferase